MSTKTAVSILQEYMVKHSTSIPPYVCIYDGSSSGKVCFKFQLCYKIFKVVGEGTSKKEAKQNAAQAMLTELGIGCNVNPPRSSNVQQTINAIGRLTEYCCKKKYATPTYEIVSETGPPHCKQFTIKCSVGTHYEMGVATTKQEAKHLSAKKLLEKFQEVFGAEDSSLAGAEEAPFKLDTAHLKEAIEKFKSTSSLMKSYQMKQEYVNFDIKDSHKLLKSDANLNCNIVNSLANMLKKKEKVPFNTNLEMNYEFIFNKLLEELKVPQPDFITVTPHKKSNYLLVLNMNYKIPVSFLGFGTSKSLAKQSAITDAIKWIITMYM